ncbi:MAG: J domain-containing protein [Spirochaetaceae bacterium]|jgi:curved DNA-binding protein CbpA|nr:J domain-containing protein [Spirochaetaceae bacterium]
MTLTECFRILDLPKNARLEELKGAYRSKAKKYHPDRQGGNSIQFNLLHEAYTFVLDHGALISDKVHFDSLDRARREREDFKRREAFRKVKETREKEAREKEEHARREEAKAARIKKQQQMEQAAGEQAAREKKEKSGSHQVFVFGEILNGKYPDREKIKALNTLVFLKRKSAYPFLKKAIYGSSEIIIMASIEAIGKLKIIQAESEFSSLMNCSTKNIKNAILNSVSLINNKNYYGNIINIALYDRDFYIRQKAEVINKRIYE